MHCRISGSENVCERLFSENDTTISQALICQHVLVTNSEPFNFRETSSDKPKLAFVICSYKFIGKT